MKRFEEIEPYLPQKQIAQVAPLGPGRGLGLLASALRHRVLFLVLGGGFLTISLTQDMPALLGAALLLVLLTTWFIDFVSMWACLLAARGHGAPPRLRLGAALLGVAALGLVSVNVMRFVRDAQGTSPTALDHCIAGAAVLAHILAHVLAMQAGVSWASAQRRGLGRLRLWPLAAAVYAAGVSGLAYAYLREDLAAALVGGALATVGGLAAAEVLARVQPSAPPAVSGAPR